MAETKLIEMLDSLVEQKTFSLEGVKAIQELRAKAVVLEASLEKTKELYTQEANRALAMDREIERLRVILGKCSSREAALLKREAAITQLEKSAAVADARAQQLAMMFDAIFRNTIFREQWQKMVPTTSTYNGNSNTNWDSQPESVIKDTV